MIKVSKREGILGQKKAKKGGAGKEGRTWANSPLGSQSLGFVGRRGEFR